MSLTPDDVTAIIGLFRDSGYGELRLRLDGLSIIVRKEEPAASDGATSGASPSSAPDSASAGDRAGAIAVRAAISGTFYRAPAPGADPFCKVGDRVRPETTLGLIEVMKLFTSVRAGLAGTIARIVPANGALVEAGQPLVLILPDGGAP